ncbi:hypothetical protein ACX80D_04475 [Arthrobacter sp. Sr24]
MMVRGSAHRHGINDEDGVEAASWPLVEVPLDDEDPRRFLRLGFDTRSRLLELIHAMKCRPKYLSLLD